MSHIEHSWGAGQAWSANAYTPQQQDNATFPARTFGCQRKETIIDMVGRILEFVQFSCGAASDTAGKSSSSSSSRVKSDADRLAGGMAPEAQETNGPTIVTH